MSSPAFALHFLLDRPFTYEEYMERVRAAGFELRMASARLALQPLVKLGLVSLQKGGPPTEPHAFVSRVPPFLVEPLAHIVESHRRRFTKDERELRNCAAALHAFLRDVAADPRTITRHGSDALSRVRELIILVEDDSGLTEAEISRAWRSIPPDRAALLEELYSEADEHGPPLGA